MKELSMGKSVSYQEGLLKSLKDPEDAAAYINAALEEGDEKLLLVALRNVAEAHGMTAVARKARVNRENLYRMLSKKGNPRLQNIEAVLEACGLKLAVQPREITQ
jgi:probable addiction module antidote protein